MPYRPKFCCECGEKIERLEWKIWTNRRFCEVCEAEHKLSDLLPKAGVLICLLLGLFGLGSFLRGGSGDDAPLIKRTLTSGQPVIQANITANRSMVTGNRSSISETSATPDITSQKRAAVAAVEPVYICGARTRKGTPCTRRVKGNVRCWQHTGMPAMEPAEKLVVSR